MSNDPTDQELFEAALDNAPAPEPDVMPEVQAPEPSAPVRDEAGRFAADATPAEPEVQTPEPQPTANIPSSRLREEAERARRAEAREQELLERLSRLERAQAPQAPQAPPKEPDWLDEPGEYVDHRTRAVISPLQAAINFNSRLTAEAVHTADRVKEAEAEFNRLTAERAINPRVYQEIQNSPNPYHAAVLWHQQQKKAEVFSKFGDDPEAAINAEVERRLAAMQAAPVTAAKTAPSVRLPPSLNRTTSAAPSAGEGGGDPSDNELYLQALNSKRR